MERENHRVDSSWNMRNKKMKEEMAKEKNDRDLIRSGMGQGHEFSTLSRAALVPTSCSVIPFATRFLPGYINEYSTFHLKHTPDPNSKGCSYKSPSLNQFHDICYNCK